MWVFVVHPLGWEEASLDTIILLPLGLEYDGELHLRDAGIRNIPRSGS